jgi:hypothetical protein
MLIQSFLIRNPFILTDLIKTHGHPRDFRSLQNFIQQFLKEKSSFLTKMLKDQSTNNRLMNRHQIEKIILILLNIVQKHEQPLA